MAEEKQRSFQSMGITGAHLRKSLNDFEKKKLLLLFFFFEENMKSRGKTFQNPILI